MPPGRTVFHGAPSPTSSDAGNRIVVGPSVTVFPNSGALMVSGCDSAEGCVSARSTCPASSAHGLRRHDKRSGRLARDAPVSAGDAITTIAEPFHIVPLASASSTLPLLAERT